METLIIETQEQADALVVGTILKFDGNIIFKCPIKAAYSIEAGGYIKAAYSIEAAYSIKAGGYIEAAYSIEAGDGYGIYCGMAYKLSEKDNATITAKVEPKNICLGVFVKGKNCE